MHFTERFIRDNLNATNSKTTTGEKLFSLIMEGQRFEIACPVQDVFKTELELKISIDGNTSQQPLADAVYYLNSHLQEYSN